MKRPAWLVLALAAATAAALLVWQAWRRPGAPLVRAGGRLRIVQCPIHGIAHDLELEACPACARAPRPPGGGA